MGHVVDLPKKELGIDIEHDFAPKYEDLPKKKATIAELKKAAKGAAEIFLATDPDREGEAIAWHLGQIVGDGKTKRVSFHEITEEAVKHAFEEPRELNLKLVDSQQARRVLDRLVGYKLSPLLWKKIRYGLSAGRVQSVAVRLIVEREREREAFHPEEYWEIAAKLSDGGEFEAKLTEKDSQKVKIGTKEEAESIEKELKTANFLVSSIEKGERKRNPYPPFTTSTLQQAGVNVLGFSSKRTMRAAQALYEAGLITYHRTDSVNLSEKALNEIREFIRISFGSNYLPETANRYKTKVRLAQEAHEAVRPTRSEVASSELQVASDEKKVYELIWRQAVASQMVPSVREEIKISITASNYLLTANGSRLIFDGWEKISGKAGEEKTLPVLAEGEKLKLLELVPSQHFTEPPARYTEATLIKKLEEEGIGRPSTYAPIISTIQDRGYVSKEGRALRPEDVGKIVNDLLVAYFPDVVDLSFTAKMEEGLDEIARGEKEWVPIIRDFYGPFSEELVKAEENIDKSSLTTIAETDEKCPESGHPLIIKLGRYGKFYSCSGFPGCRYARPYIERIGMKCLTCGEGDIIIRKTKRGKTFYGCSRYPECKFASWDDPRKQKANESAE
ncbi:DNA topoisomerase I [candidate division WWE3 bacterium RIFCSPHIGHO2_01_FULL_48_15]|uniref:DNA topoisomerase 1 n=1 Tax=candidate division WWE3 bacterium RIFCSPHIGHO2_01_FULL_48_15 TaxID=1802619 RepID=A0A1F4VBX0_UNCKA|nr:MAG: DNA topoisomerase I [candidate division WWE3 bacterium RIFCSPHIGHO2_01_FULL_48_15]